MLGLTGMPVMRILRDLDPTPHLKEWTSNRVGDYQ